MHRINAILLIALATATSAPAQSYEVSWWTVDGGGTMNAVGGTLALSGTAGQPDAGGPFAGGTFGAYGGFWAVAAGTGVVLQANLGITKTDGVSTVNPGARVTYTIVASNAGPSPVTSAIVADTPPASLANVLWFCAATAGSSCPASGAGSINSGVDLVVGGSATFTLQGDLSAVATGTLSNSVTVSTPAGVLDPSAANNVATDNDVIVRIAEGELAHGSQLRADLASTGGTGDTDLYHIRLQPYSSYEVVLDEASGDISNGTGPELELVLSDGATLVEDSQPVGAGSARSLRVANGTSSVQDSLLVRVASSSCTTSCGPDDVYRLRVWDTTASIPRFNNGGQVTVLFLQNVTDDPISVQVQAWSTSGSLLGFQGTQLAPHALWVLNTSPLAPGASGSLTIQHDGPYGGLAGKAVALEPASGYSFDSPMVWKTR